MPGVWYLSPGCIVVVYLCPTGGPWPNLVVICVVLNCSGPIVGLPVLANMLWRRSAAHMMGMPGSTCYCNSWLVGISMLARGIHEPCYPMLSWTVHNTCSWWLGEGELVFSRCPSQHWGPWWCWGLYLIVRVVHRVGEVCYLTAFFIIEPWFFYSYKITWKLLSCMWMYTKCWNRVVSYNLNVLNPFIKTFGWVKVLQMESHCIFHKGTMICVLTKLLGNYSHVCGCIWIAEI